MSNYEQRSLSSQARLAFARNLKQRRLAAGYLRAAPFAAAVGLEEHRYLRYERAEVEPSLALIHTLSAVLNTTADELLGVAPSRRTSSVGGSDDAGRKLDPDVR